MAGRKVTLYGESVIEMAAAFLPIEIWGNISIDRISIGDLSMKLPIKITLPLM
jgi:hypothetical protein